MIKTHATVGLIQRWTSLQLDTTFRIILIISSDVVLFSSSLKTHTNKRIIWFFFFKLMCNAAASNSHSGACLTCLCIKSLSADRLQEKKLSQRLWLKKNKYSSGSAWRLVGEVVFEEEEEEGRNTKKIPIPAGGSLVNVQRDVKNSISNFINFRQTPDSLQAVTCLLVLRVHAEWRGKRW